MTNRLSLDPPLASADTWAGRQARYTMNMRASEAKIEEIRRDMLARRDRAECECVEPETPHTQTVTPLAEHLVLDCIRALKVISPSPYALDLMDMISRVYVIAPEHMVRMRRIEAMLEISSEEPAS